MKKATLMFRCIEKRESGNSPGQKMGGVKLTPHLPPKEDPHHEEMRRFYAYTPGGQIDFSTVNQAVLDEMEIGEDYLITIERVPRA